MMKKLLIALGLAAVVLHGAEMVKGTPGIVSWDKITPMPFYRWVEGGKPPIETEARFMYNDNSLFVRLVCSEPNITEARQQPRYEVHDSEVWTNDCAEIFISPEDGSGRVFQLVSDVHNSGAELCWNDSKYAKNIDWNGYWSHKTSYFDDHYIIDVEIPWRTIGITSARNKTFKLNITRVRKIAPWGRYSLSEKQTKRLLDPQYYISFTGINVAPAPLTGSVITSIPLSGKNSLRAQVKSVSKKMLEGKLALIVSGRDKDLTVAEVPVKIAAGKSISKNIAYNMDNAGSFPVKLLFVSKDGNAVDIWADTVKYNPPIDIASTKLVTVKGRNSAVFVRLFGAQTKGTAKVEIINSKGKVVAGNSFNFSSREFFLNVPSAKIAAGDYTVRITVAGFSQALPLTVIPDIIR